MTAGHEFRNALELASTGRYKEAKEKLDMLLALDPGNARALALLGKVEYYLGHFSASRKAFELSLSYDPSDFSSYLGIQYFKERNLKTAIVVLFISFVLLFLAGNAVVFNVFSGINEKKLVDLETDLTLKLDALESEISSLLEGQAKNAADNTGRIEDLAGFLRKSDARKLRVLMDVLKRLDELENR